MSADQNNAESHEKKHKKHKKDKHKPEEAGHTGQESVQSETVELMEKLMLLSGGGAEGTAPKRIGDAARKKYEFWETQPVPKFDANVTGINDSIEPDKPISEIRQEPLSLPDQFYWDDVKLDDKAQLKELYTLLTENYVEDDDNMFRFDYSPEFLQWALQPPGWLPQWHVGIRVKASKKLVCFISAVPSLIRIYDKLKKMVDINFLCVHKKLRSKRVAPVLIREITRRVNLTGIFQAVYTAGVVLPRPVATCRYWHRSLNPKKLIDVKFSHLSRNMTLQRTIKLYRLPDQPLTQGFRVAKKEDMSTICKLLNDHLSKSSLCPTFTEDECIHWFTPREGVLESYVVENNGSVTDFVSFYSLPSTVVNHPLHKTLEAAYLFYHVAQSTKLESLINDALIVAKNVRFNLAILLTLITLSIISLYRRALMFSTRWIF